MKIVNSWNDFDPLKHVIVGRADNCCIAPSEPASKAKVPLDSPMRGMTGPRPLDTVEKANAQLDNLCKILESGSGYSAFYDGKYVWLYASSRCIINNR